MKAKELLLAGGQLSRKTRTVKDLTRFISTRENKDTSNYSLFLGAGASKSSGISTALELIDIWKRELYERFEDKQFEPTDDYKNIEQYFEHKHPSWFNSVNPYSSLFEKKFDLPSQRRKFVEQQVGNKLPSIGYAYLVSLVEKGFFNTIFTTNFDDLLNESFYQLSSTRPIVCAHDSSVHSISITSKRPKILKLHGDYLFENIKSTLRETESLEQNIKDKLIEFCKEFGLIILGYSGSDRSIMDVLEYLVKTDNYVKNGVYWCFRKEDEINQSVMNLLWKDKVYPIIIDGFDEFFASLYNELTGEYGKLFNSDKESQRDKIISKIMDNFSRSDNEIIKRELEELYKSRDKVDISNFLNIKSSDKSKEKISLKNFRNILEVSEKAKVDPNEAYLLCERYFNDLSTKDDQERYIKRLIDLALMSDQKSQAMHWANELINLDEFSDEHYLIKLSLINDLNEKNKFLSNSIKKLNKSYSLLNKQSDLYFSMMRNDSSLDYFSDIDKNINLSLKLNPSLYNKAFLQKHKLLTERLNKEDNEKDKNKYEEEIDKLIKDMKSSNKNNINYIIIRSLEAERISKESNAIETIKDIISTRDKKERSSKERINEIISSLLEKILSFEDSNGYGEAHKDFYDSIKEDNLEEYTSRTLIHKSLYDFFYRKDIDLARKYLRFAMKKEDIDDELELILDASSIIDINFLKEIESYIEDIKYGLKQKYYFSLKDKISSIKGDFDSALSFIEQERKYDGDFREYLISKTYYLLKLGKYQDVIDVFNKNKGEFKSNNFDIFKINYLIAKGKLDGKINEDEINKINSRTKDEHLKVATSILLQNKKEQGYSNLKKLINKNPKEYYVVKNWVFIDESKILSFNPAPQ
ncbi:SIR2 family protein [Aggregatibacter sp. 2125159857]|uniref:SIR2 family protein n=1 Tax=Aggregatibacter sp. 2125159857 TaxID=2820817 RepID=UPI001ADFFE65|nr:SIR2 family protein [Aggregatibacter sp. 2125159857]QTO01413.1 SIR2 family protein [Aggregatibacter sp. 2125159857]